MRGLDYALREGWRGLRRSGIAGLLATAATALAVIVLGTLLLVTSNVQRLVETWTAGAEFSVFLRDDATSDDRGAIEAEIDRSGIAVGRTYLSKSEALARFRREFTDVSALADALEDNPFPASIEVRVRADADRDGRTADAVHRVSTLAGVADVRYDRQWLATLETVLVTVRGVGLGLGVLVALAAAATVASVVRLGLEARRPEVEIMQLVGSPLSYIQGPFIAEGLLQGGLGSFAALVVLGVAFRAGLWRWGGAAQAILDGEALRFLAPQTLLVLLVGGMAVGAFGGFAASRHAR